MVVDGERYGDKADKVAARNMRRDSCTVVPAGGKKDTLALAAVTLWVGDAIPLNDVALVAPPAVARDEEDDLTAAAADDDSTGACRHPRPCAKRRVVV